MRLAALLAAGTFLYAQDPAFEAATVKINRAGPDAPNGFFPTPGRLRVTNMPLDRLIQAAFHIKTGMLFGTTGWMESDRFDIDAKAPGKSNFEDDLVMLRALLADQFQLKFHREIRPLKMQVLVLAKGGPHFAATKDQEQKEQITIRPGEISGTAIPFGHFVTILETQLGYPILNETGLKGSFDLSLKFARDEAFASLEDLGLKIESRKAPVEVFVIDSAVRPRD